MPINPLTGLEEDELTGITNQYDSDLKALQANQSGYDTTGAITGALASLGAAFQGKDSMAAVNQIQNQRREAQKDKLSALDRWKQMKMQDIAAKRDATKFKREDVINSQNDDPNSDLSRSKQQLAMKVAPNTDVSKLSGAQLDQLLPVVMKKHEIDQSRLNRLDAREERRQLADMRKEEHREKSTNDDIQKLSKDVAGTQEMLTALDDVEGKLGGTLDDFTVDGNGNLIKEGKTVDLPGVSIPGLGRVTAYNRGARNLHDAAAKVFNATLKDRSGGSVTDSEMERLKREFSEGKYNTESELVDALKRYKRQTQVVLKNREAAYRPDVVSRYTEQGGRTSLTMPKTSEPPRDKDAETYAQMHNIPYDKALSIITKRRGSQIAGGM